MIEFGTLPWFAVMALCVLAVSHLSLEWDLPWWGNVFVSIGLLAILHVAGVLA